MQTPTDNKFRNRFARAWRTTWSILSWIALVLIVCAVGGGLYFYHRVDDELRAFVQSKATQQFPDLSITIGSARLLQGEGVRIRDISVIQTAANDSQDNRSRAEILFIDEIFLRCAPTLQELLLSKVNIKHIHIRGATLRAERRPDGSINLADILPLPCSADPKKLMPPTTIENAAVEFIDRLAAPARLIAFSQVTLNVTPRRSSDPNNTQAAMRVAGSFSNESFRDATVEADFEPCGHEWSITGKVPRIRLNPEFYGSLPAEMDSLLTFLPSFRATAAIDSFQIANSADLPKPTFQVQGSISDGRFENHQLQRPITDINAKFECDERTLTVKPLTARYGDSRVTLVIQRHGYDAKSPTHLWCDATRLAVNRKLLESLPIAANHKRSLLETFDKFKPVGILSGIASTVFNGKRWTYDAMLDCNDMSFTHRDFPYPIVQCRQGWVRLTNDLLKFKLLGKAGNAPVDVSGNFKNPGPTATGEGRIKTRQPLAIDDALIAAANPKLRDFVQRLKLRGRVTVNAIFRKDEPRIGPMDREITIGLTDGWVKYSAFPYPISNIDGDIKLNNDTWTFSNLKGVNDRCTITCSGDRIPGRPIPLQLKFGVTDVPLDHDLRSAVPPHVRKMWDDIQPRGVVDNATIWLDHATGMSKPDVRIVAAKGPRKPDSLPTDDLRIRPVWFSYPFDAVTGAIAYENGTIRNLRRPLRAKHQRVRLSTDLQGEFSRNGRWDFQLPKMIVHGLQLPDKQFSSALPKDLAIAMDRLKFQGFIAINGQLGFSGNARSDSVRTNWAVDLDMENASFNAGLDMHGAHGRVRLSGEHLDRNLECRGNLRLESIMHKDIQFTDVRSPLWFDGSTLIVGSKVPANIGASPPQLRARVHGGMLFADATVVVQDTPFFKLVAQLEDANVRSLARDIDPKYSGITGKLSGGINLKGSAKGWSTLDGKGTLHVREANLYELPVVLALLKRLRHGDSDNSAFTTCDLSYEITGQDILFDQFDLSGESLTLKGTGWSGPQNTTTLDNASRKISLDFYSIVGRENMLMPILRPVLGEASRQFLLVEVRGTLDNPTTRQKVLPGLNDALQSAFPELTSESPPTARSRGILRKR